MTLDISSYETLGAYMSATGQAARDAFSKLRLASKKQKNAALTAMASHIRTQKNSILSANEIDMKRAAQKNLSQAMLDRLKLTNARIESIAKGLADIAALPDPVGEIETKWTQPNGLQFEKRKIPIGVIGMIYESRPNVTADAGGLCVKSGNACVLRGGSESTQSNLAIHSALTRGLVDAGLPETSIQYIQTTNREAVGHLLRGMGGAVDLIIPRGGNSLIERVQSDARVPVLAHLEGLCHSYVHENADLDKATKIVINAKMRRTGVCGATETLLIDREIAPNFLPEIAAQLTELGCELRGDDAAQAITKMQPASAQDFYTEHLSPILNVAIVDNIDAALAHINIHSSGHTDAIITENQAAADRFLAEVDSAICVHNASTQFADGGEFGFGAEIGIATGRLHARGPVGAQHLTTYKYAVRGTGQIRPV